MARIVSLKAAVVAAALGIGASGLLGGAASATPLGAPLVPGWSTDIIWTSSAGGGVVSGLGTSDVFLDGVNATTLTLSVAVTVAAGSDIGGIFGSLGFDLDLGDELNGPGTLTEFPNGALNVNPIFGVPAGYNDSLIMPATQDSTLGGVSGYGLGLDMICLGGCPVGLQTFTAFTVSFAVNNANLATDGNDVLWGTYGTGNIIGAFTGGTPVYNASNSPWAGASVNMVPEPGALPLIALATGALLMIGRSTQRS